MPVLGDVQCGFGERSEASRTAIGPACRGIRARAPPGQLAGRQLAVRRLPIAGSAATKLIRPMLPLLAIMFGVLPFVSYVPESFMWLPRCSVCTEPTTCWAKRSRRAIVSMS
jgi:hypothetical protein